MKKYLTFILLLSCIGILHAQGWSVQLVHPSRPYIYSEDLWHCYVTNPDTTSQEITLYCWVIHDGEEIAHGRSNSITVSPGRNHITSRDINDVIDEHYVDPYEDILERRGALPAGSYTFCVRVEDAATHSEFTSNCRDYAARGAGVLRLISPMDDATVHMENPTFIWAPLSPAGSVDHYSIKIVQIPEDMCADEAMSSAEPWYEDDDINTTNFRYPLSARTLRDGENYAWQVKAFGESDIVISTSDIWDITIGTPGTESDDECACGGWEYLNVSWNGGSQSILPCGGTGGTVFVPLGTEVAVSGEYTCNPDDPDICSVTYSWAWDEFDPQDPYLIFDSEDSNGQVDECDFTLIIDDAPCCTVFVFSYCNGEFPACEQCHFKICTDSIPSPPCECGEEWGESLKVEVNGVQYIVDCQSALDTIQLGTIQLPTSSVTITPNYVCDPASCPVTYEVTITPPAPASVFTTSFTGSSHTFTPITAAGCYNTEITALCGGDSCETCTFVVCCDDSCECGEEWGESLKVEVNGVQYIVDCQSAPDTIQLGTIQLPTSSVTITPNYVCDPASCPVTYEVTITPPAPASVFTTSFTGSSHTFTPITAAGCYNTEITALCGGDSCETCTFVVCCDSIIPVDTCECGGWESLNVTWDDTTAIITTPCIWPNTDTIWVDTGTIVTVDGNYSCYPDDPNICNDTYYWHWQLDGPPYTSDAGTVNELTQSFTFNATGCYHVEIFPYCGEMLCDTCTFVVCCDSIIPVDTCECGGWESLNVTWNNKSQSLIPSSFPAYRGTNPESTTGFHPNPEIPPDTIHIVTGATVTVNGSYFCLPESYGCLESYEWEVIEYESGTPAGVPIVYSTGSSTCQFSFTVEKDNCYQISIYPYCNDIMCERDEYRFIVCTEDSNRSPTTPEVR